MTLGQRIYQLRTKMHLSQGDLADKLEVSRQSVSKWETDASVPELDKLVRLSQLFGVTLDSLVIGAEPTPQPEPTAQPAPEPESAPARWSGRKIAGWALIALGVVIVVLFLALTGSLAGTIFSLPLFLCGLICLTVRRHPGLWCAWAVYIPQQLYWTYATGITWRLTFWTMQFTPEMNYMRLAIGWLMLLAMLGLLIGTSRAFRNAILEPGRKSAALCIGLWLLFGLLLVPFPLLFDSLLIALREIVRLAALTAALAVTLARLRGRRAAR